MMLHSEPTGERRKSMSRELIVAVFPSRIMLTRALDHLMEHNEWGIQHTAIVAKANTGEVVILDDNIGADEGGIAGGTLGAALTLFSIAQLGALALPGIGPIIALGAGALVGGLAESGVAATRLLPVQTMLFVMANGLLILLGLYLAGQGRMVLQLERLGGRAWPLLRAASRHFPSASTPLGQVAAGTIWGWTPCGLVYSMLALALLSGSAARGALLMMAFGLGTLPNLLASGWLIRRFGKDLKRPRVRMAAGLAVAAFGVIGLLRAPDLAQHLREGLLCLGG